MKIPLPAHSHTAETMIYVDEHGRLMSLIDIEFRAPSYVSAMLPEAKGFHHIQCSNIIDLKDAFVRARSWKNPRKYSHSLEKLFRDAIMMGCHSRIRMQMKPEVWHLTGYLCGKLGITPGQWLLGCAAYNATIEDRQIEAKLAAINDAPVTE